MTITIDGTPLHEQHWPSLHDMLDRVEATRTHGTYQAIAGSASGSLSVETGWSGPPLESFVQMCRTGRGFRDATEQLDGMVAMLTATLPPLPSIQRTRCLGPHGHTLRVTRLLRGDLRRAWVQSERQTHPNPRPFVTLLVDACVHGGVTAAGIFWSTAATLTLAALLENAGRRVGLLAWDCSETALGSQTGGYLPHAWTVMLKHYAEPWQVQDVICTTNQAFLRRLMFRLNEASPLGAREGYGNVPSAQWKTRTLQALAAAYGWPCLLIGANPSHDRIDRMESALAWVTKQLTTLEAA